MNDNLFKLFMIYALIAWEGEAARSEVLALVGLAFALPFLLIIPVAGAFADHFSKRWMIVILKAVEIAVMSFGIYALSSGNSIMLYLTMILMSSQSAFFGPNKYGIIPEQVGTERLSRANGMLQMFTFLAILAGTIIAPELSLALDGHYAKAAGLCLIVAIAGFLFSLGIEPTPAHPRRPIRFNGFINLIRSTRVIRRDGFLSLAVLAVSFFSFVGAYTQLNILDYGAQHLGLGSEQATRLFLLTAIGIGSGSVIAGWISGRLIEFGIVPVGTVIMFVCLLVIGTVPEGSHITVSICMLLIGIGAGFYIVPLESFIQYRSPKDKVGSVKAANGFLNWIGILLASGLLYLNSSVLGWSAQTGFLVMSILLLGLAVFSFWILPDFFVKFVVMCIVRTFYRLRVYGVKNLPTERAALLVCNHVSLMDALLVVSSQQRRIRTLMSRNVYDQSGWFVQRIVDLAGVILIQDTDGPKKLVASLKNARKALDEGYLVCIFAEGGLTLSGLMKPFKPGFERIIKGSDHPIIPIYISGAWGSQSSWKYGIPKLNPLGEFRYPVSVHFGKAMPATTTVPEVQEAVREVSTETFEIEKEKRQSLGEAFVRIARRNWRKVAVVGAPNDEWTYGRLLTTALQLEKQISRRLQPDEHTVAIASADPVHLVLVNLALTLSRKASLHVDYSGDVGVANRVLRKAGCATLLASVDFLSERPDFKPKAKIFEIDELVNDGMNEAGVFDAVKARFASVTRLCETNDFDPDTVAAIQFTRGNTGEPKGVRLSHHNILSNLESLREVLRPVPNDTLLGTLPFFRIYGYSITFWFPLLSGIQVVYGAGPDHETGIGELAEEYQGTILPTTPNALRRFTLNIKPEQFRSLRYVFSSAKKLPDAWSRAFEEKFSIHPLEAYGATELSPVCALSIPDIQISRFSETGVREGYIGRLLPGIAVEICDPVSFDRLPPGEVGLIYVKGPNVMLGYLGDPVLTEAAVQEGWYSTGDLGSMDMDGFLSVKGRLG